MKLHYNPFTGEGYGTNSFGWTAAPTMGETYRVDISPGQDDLLILASVLALDLAHQAEFQGN